MLRFVALCVVRCGLSSCVDLCVASICVAFGCVLLVVVCRLALICVAFGCFVCCLLWFVVLRCVWLRCVLFVVVYRLALIYVLHRFVLRFVALCVVRRGLSYRVDLCVA